MTLVTPLLVANIILNQINFEIEAGHVPAFCLPMTIRYIIRRKKPRLTLADVLKLNLSVLRPMQDFGRERTVRYRTTPSKEKSS